MMHALNDVASQVTVETMKIEDAQEYFLSYCATNLDASIVYYASDIIIWGDTNTVNFIASKTRGNKDQNN